MNNEIYYKELMDVVAGSSQSSSPEGSLNHACYNVILEELRKQLNCHWLDVVGKYPMDLLSGYADTLAEVLVLEAGFTEGLHDYFHENEIFVCEECGWWGHPGEPLNEDGLCSDCEEGY